MSTSLYWDAWKCRGICKAKAESYLCRGISDRDFGSSDWFFDGDSFSDNRNEKAFLFFMRRRNCKNTFFCLGSFYYFGSSSFHFADIL